MRWLVDGMNVIGTRPDGWWRDRDAAMARLVDLLERFVAESGDDVTVIFERAPRPPLRSSLVEVGHAKRRGPDAADFEIVRRVDEDADPRSIQVVTSDRWLAERVSAAGALVHPAEPFRARLEP
jgi:predicted RNA-binding protein with PIN domain